MKLSISDFLLWRDCPYKAHALISNGYGGRYSSALSVGQSLHAYLEWILKGRLGDPPPLPEDPEDAIEVAPLIASVADWTPPFEVLSTEEVLSFPITPTLELVGTLDGRVLSAIHIGMWSAQWKTIAKGRRLDLELERVRMSPHEILYHKLSELCLGVRLEGTILGTFRKLPKKDLEAGSPVFALHYLPRTKAEVDEAYTNDLLPQLYACAADLEARRAPRAWESCLGAFGNSPCPLYTHCHMGVPLEACGLPSRVDRYAGIGNLALPPREDPPGA